jgi:histidine triad (HIT) family protein
MEDCIFCNIVERKAPADIEYEDDVSIAFKDTDPRAPVHILIIPKKHIGTTLDVNEEDAPLLGHLIRVANKIARGKNISEKGFRLVMNCGLQSGQSVWHVHLHLLGGRRMTWPPG